MKNIDTFSIRFERVLYICIFVFLSYILLFSVCYALHQHFPSLFLFLRQDGSVRELLFHSQKKHFLYSVTFRYSRCPNRHASFFNYQITSQRIVYALFITLYRLHSIQSPFFITLSLLTSLQFVLLHCLMYFLHV